MCAEHGVLEAVCTKCNPSSSRSSRPRATGARSTASRSRSVRSATPSAAAAGGGRRRRTKRPADGTKVRFKTQGDRRHGRHRDRHGGRAARRRRRRGRRHRDGRLRRDPARAEVNARVARRGAGAQGRRRHQGQAGRAARRHRERRGRRRPVEAPGGADARARSPKRTYKREQAAPREGIAPQKDVLAAQQELDAGAGRARRVAAPLSAWSAAGRSGAARLHA